MTWKPAQSDLDWVQSLISMVRQDGLWTLPGTLNTYRINHDKKQFIHLIGETTDQTHLRTRECLLLLGWSMTEGHLHDPISGTTRP